MKKLAFLEASGSSAVKGRGYPHPPAGGGVTSILEGGRAGRTVGGHGAAEREGAGVGGQVTVSLRAGRPAGHWCSVANEGQRTPLPAPEEEVYIFVFQKCITFLQYASETCYFQHSRKLRTVGILQIQ